MERSRISFSKKDWLDECNSNCMWHEQHRNRNSIIWSKYPGISATYKNIDFYIIIWDSYGAILTKNLWGTVNEGKIYFPLFLEHFQDFILKGLLQVFQHKAGCRAKVAIVQKASIRNDSMEMWIKILKIPVGLHRNAGAGNSIIIWYSRFQICAEYLPSTDTELCQ